MLVDRVDITDRLAKTELGRLEIRAPVHALSRSARNLLLIVDGTRPITEWLSMVNGATTADIEALLQARLLEPAPHVVPQQMMHAAPQSMPGPPLVKREASPAPMAPTVPIAPSVAPEEVLSYQELYAALNGMAREQLGLIKGYRFSLEIERASGLAELQDVARRFVLEVQHAKGDAVARQVLRALKLVF